MALGLAGLLGLGVGAGTGTALAAFATGPAEDGGPSSGLATSAERAPSAAPSATPSSVVSSVETSPAAATSTPTLSVEAVADLAAGILSRALPTSASGELVTVPGEVAAPNPAAASVRAVRVEVERGLDIDPVAFAAMVMDTLNDPRGWGAGGTISFARTEADAPIRVVLATPDLVDTLCAPLTTRGFFSCASDGHAAINHTRWVTGTSEFPDLTVYRQYVVNHEVGHLLGHPHVSCPGAGLLAPIMQQQTVAVAPCLPNDWPFPEAT